MIVKREQLVRISTADTIVSVQMATKLIPVAIVAVSMILKYRFSLILFFKDTGNGQSVCPEGFWGLGDSCFDLDECGHSDFNDCKDGTTCHNHDGGYSCVCPNGVEANSNGDCLDTGYEKT